MTSDELCGVWTGDASADGLPENKVKIEIARCGNTEQLVWTSRLVSMQGAPIISHEVCTVAVITESIERHIKAGFVKEYSRKEKEA